MRRNPRELSSLQARTSRRAVLLGGAMAAFSGGLALRMRYLQVEQADQFRLLAEENRINFRLIAPPRGFITDRNGDYLAINVQNYRVVLVREQAKTAGGVEAVLDKLSQSIDVNEHKIGRAHG